jgi:hypothetical protein
MIQLYTASKWEETHIFCSNWEEPRKDESGTLGSPKHARSTYRIQAKRVASAKAHGNWGEEATGLSTPRHDHESDKQNKAHNRRNVT